MIRRIMIATDLSAEGASAFRSALALAVARRAKLDILHVSPREEPAPWGNFPRVRETLEQWGMLPKGSRQEDVERQLGVAVTKVEAHGGDPISRIADYVSHRTPDLFVAASHGRAGQSFWERGSIAVNTMRETALPALLFGPSAGELCDHNGRLRLRSALVPVAATPPAHAALAQFMELVEPAAPLLHVIHIEKHGAAPVPAGVLPEDVVRVQGDVVPSILDAADKLQVDLIAMATARHRGLLDAFRGSTTAAILQRADRPILALPV